MERSPQLSVPYLLRKLLAQGDHIVAEHHPWLWEHDRWKELVFCILSQTVDADQHELRSITDQLNSLGLLQVDYLANLLKEGKKSISENPDADEFVDFLTEHGFDKDAAEKSIRSLAEAAAGLRKHFEGKIQLYLRHYGELILKDLSKQFRFTHLDPAEARRAFVFWLQNVLTLPLSLENPAMERFAKNHDIEIKDLVQAADDMGLNVSLLDDLVENSEAISIRMSRQHEE